MNLRQTKAILYLLLELCYARIPLTDVLVVIDVCLLYLLLERFRACILLADVLVALSHVVDKLPFPLLRGNVDDGRCCSSNDVKCRSRGWSSSSCQRW